MKKNILFVAILATSLSFGQNTFPASGNVGIGTVNPSSGSPLEIKSLNDAILSLQTVDDSWLYTQWLSSSGARKVWMGLDSNLKSFNIALENGADKILFNGGNVGIGTYSPFSKFTIGGTLSASTSQLSIVNNEGGHAIIRTGIAGITNQGISFLTANIDGSNQQNTMVISADNNVGIGTSSPDAKLTVNGNIHAKEVKIDLSILAPDYVFASNYKLKTLKEVETYINKNSHLPEIPSAKEFEKNGLLLAEMNMSLLKKVEELTLYAIEQDKKVNTKSNEIEGLKKDIEKLKKDNEIIKVLAERLAKMENKLRQG